jgi:short-subunit dehydrogenase
MMQVSFFLTLTTFKKKHQNMNRKTLFITGAAEGIGKAIAKLYISKGWTVGILDINENTLNNTIQEIGNNAKPYVGSVTNDEDVSHALKSFTDLNGGKLDLLINNAGVLYTGEYDELDFEDHLAMVNVNLIGLMRVTYLAIPYLKNAKKSGIVNIASISAVTGVPQLEVYAATKSAVKSLTETFYLTLKKHGIKVSAILPHLVDTKMVEDNKESLGVKSSKEAKSTPQQVANKVWKAANGSGVHYPVSLDASALYILSGLLPTKWLLGAIKSLVKYK